MLIFCLNEHRIFPIKASMWFYASAAQPLVVGNVVGFSKNPTLTTKIRTIPKLNSGIISVH